MKLVVALVFVAPLLAEGLREHVKAVRDFAVFD